MVLCRWKAPCLRKKFFKPIYYLLKFSKLGYKQQNRLWESL